MRGKPETPRRAGALLSAVLAGAIMPLSTAESAALEGALRSRPTLTVLGMYVMTVVGAECTVTVSSVCIAVRTVFPALRGTDGALVRALETHTWSGALGDWNSVFQTGYQ